MPTWLTSRSSGTSLRSRETGCRHTTGNPEQARELADVVEPEAERTLVADELDEVELEDAPELPADGVTRRDECRSSGGSRSDVVD